MNDPQVRQPVLVASVTIAMTVRVVSRFMASSSGRDDCSEWVRLKVKQLYIATCDVQIQRSHFFQHGVVFFQHRPIIGSYIYSALATGHLCADDLPEQTIIIGEAVMKAETSLSLHNLLLLSVASFALCLATAPVAANDTTEVAVADSNSTDLPDDGSQKDWLTDNSDCDSNRLDDVWLISTRHLGCPSWDKTADVDLRVEHYLGKEVDWVDSSLGEFLTSNDPTTPMFIYVHGNQISRYEAIVRALRLQRNVLGCNYVSPVRLVIWSWPSEKARGYVRDARVKAARTNIEGYYFGSFLSQLDSTTTVNIVAYSFGARVTSGALHLLGGGELLGRTLPGAHSRPPHSFRVAMLAAALHSHWLQSGACHEFAMSQMDRLLLQYNSCDPVLQRYRFIEKHGRPAALGYTGMYVDETQGVWIEQRDACCIVGKSHAEINYTTSPELMQQIHNVLFLP